MSKENDDVYIDLLLSNPIQATQNNRVQVAFNHSSTQALLNSTNGYKLSIIRFFLNTETLPVFIPTMQDDTRTIYSVSLEYNGFTMRQYMIFEPQNLNPVSAEEKYYVYNYQWLIYLINQCFQSCFNQLNETAGFPKASYVIASFDNNTQKISLNIDPSYYGYNQSGRVNIYVNNAMYALLSSLPFMYVGSSNGKDYQLNYLMTQSNIMTQEYSTLSLMNPISSIIFTSNLLPIYPSSTPPIQVYQDGNLVNGSSSYASLNILTDFVADNAQFSNFVQYAPQIYRFLSLKPNSVIRNIDLSVYWQNKHTGELHKLFLNAGGSCSVKLFFTKNF